MQIPTPLSVSSTSMSSSLESSHVLENRIVCKNNNPPTENGCPSKHWITPNASMVLQPASARASSTLINVAHGIKLESEDVKTGHRDVWVDDSAMNARNSGKKRKKSIVEEEMDDDDGSALIEEGATKKKIKIDYIQEVRNRQVTFLKRKNGVMKKAMELSILCDCEVSVIIYNKDTLKMFEYGSHDVVETLRRYAHYGMPVHKMTQVKGKIQKSVIEDEAEEPGSGEGLISLPNYAHYGVPVNKTKQAKEGIRECIIEDEDEAPGSGEGLISPPNFAVREQHELHRNRLDNKLGLSPLEERYSLSNVTSAATPAFKKTSSLLSR